MLRGGNRSLGCGGYQLVAQWRGLQKERGGRGPAMPNAPTGAVTGTEEESVGFLQGGIGKFG